MVCFLQVSENELLTLRQAKNRHIEVSTYTVGNYSTFSTNNMTHIHKTAEKGYGVLQANFASISIAFQHCIHIVG